jgi:hypothetical protein
MRKKSGSNTNMPELKFPQVLPAKATAEERKKFEALVKERDALAKEAATFHVRIREVVDRDIAALKKRGEEPSIHETQALYRRARDSVGGSVFRKVDGLNNMIQEMIDDIESRRPPGPPPKTRAEKLADIQRSRERAAQSTNPRHRAVIMAALDKEEAALPPEGGRKKGKTRKTRKSRKVTRRRH